MWWRRPDGVTRQGMPCRFSVFFKTKPRFFNANFSNGERGLRRGTFIRFSDHTEKRQRNQGMFFGSITPPRHPPTRTTFRFTPHRCVLGVCRVLVDTWQPRKTDSSSSSVRQRRVRGGGRCAWQGCSAAAAAATRAQIGQERRCCKNVKFHFVAFPLNYLRFHGLSLGYRLWQCQLRHGRYAPHFAPCRTRFLQHFDLFFQLRVAEASTRFATKRRSVRPRAWCRSWTESGSWARARAPRRRQT
jgi:hypothetical protein